jgi:hypothetical protein
MHPHVYMRILYLMGHLGVPLFMNIIALGVVHPETRSTVFSQSLVCACVIVYAIKPIYHKVCSCTVVLPVARCHVYLPGMHAT